MKLARIAAASALLSLAAHAHAEHFQYALALSGTYSVGGTAGCTDIDTTACPRVGSLFGVLSFDTPASGDGSWSIEADYGDITNFYVSLGYLPSDLLYGGVSVAGGAASGSVVSSPSGESFVFDWATRTAEYAYDFGDHAANGDFKGTLTAVPEPGAPLLMLGALATLAWLGRRRAPRG